MKQITKLALVTVLFFSCQNAPKQEKLSDKAEKRNKEIKEERDNLWKELAGTYTGYQKYTGATARTIGMSRKVYIYVEIVGQVESTYESYRLYLNYPIESLKAGEVLGVLGPISIKSQSAEKIEFECFLESTDGYTKNNYNVVYNRKSKELAFNRSDGGNEPTFVLEKEENEKKTEVNVSPVDESALTELTFEKDYYDFGDIAQGEKVAYSFKFKNTGKGDLIITSAKGSCGCIIPEWPQEPIAPGAEGVIDVVFNSDGKSGQQNKKVTIVANTVPSRTNLSIVGNVN